MKIITKLALVSSMAISANAMAMQARMMLRLVPLQVKMALVLGLVFLRSKSVKSLFTIMMV